MDSPAAKATSEELKLNLRAQLTPPGAGVKPLDTNQKLLADSKAMKKTTKDKKDKEVRGPTIPECRRNPAIERAWNFANSVMNIFHDADRKGALGSDDTRDALRDAAVAFARNEKIISASKKTKTAVVPAAALTDKATLGVEPTLKPVLNWLPLSSRNSKFVVSGEMKIISNKLQKQKFFLQADEQKTLMKKFPTLAQIEKTAERHKPLLTSSDSLLQSVNPVLDTVKTEQGKGCSTYQEVLVQTAKAANDHLSALGVDGERVKINNTDVKHYIALQKANALLKPQLLPKTLKILSDVIKEKWSVDRTPDTTGAFKALMDGSSFDNDTVNAIKSKLETEKIAGTIRYLGPNHPKVVLLQLICESAEALVKNTFRDGFLDCSPSDQPGCVKIREILDEFIASSASVYNLC